MKDRNSVFLFIAKKLEGIGQPDDDNNKTIYGITKKWYPKEYDILKNLLLTEELQDKIDDAIIDTYTKIWNRCGADLMIGNLAYFYFDFYFNSEKASVVAIQKLIAELYDNSIEIDGVLGNQTKGFIKEYLVNTDIEDVFLFNFYRRQHYYTIRRKWRCGLMNRVWKLENFIYGGK